MGNQSSQDLSLGDRLKNNVEVAWKKSTDCDFPLREGQCCCSHGNKMYVFGGVIQGQTDETPMESNDLLCFDTVNQTWMLVEAKGLKPTGRSAASLVCVGDKLYLFGGLSHQTGWLDTLHTFDTSTNTWSEVTCEGTMPSPRDKLQASVVDTCIYFFGGFGPKLTGDEEDEEDWEDVEEEDDDILEEERTQEAAQFGWFNDLFKFDTVTNRWSQPIQMNLGVPSPRAAHGMCAINRQLVIFGGRDTEKRTNDLHVFNVDNRKWNTDLKCKGQFPAPRSFHTVTAVGKRVVVMGGRAQNNEHFADFHIFDTETCEWLQPNVNGDLPAARGQHCVAVAGNHLVLHGGSSNFEKEIMVCHKFFGDVYTLPIGDILKGSSIATSGTNGQSNGHAETASTS